MRQCGCITPLVRALNFFVLSRFNKELTSRERILRHFQPRQWTGVERKIAISDNLGAISCLKGNEPTASRLRVKLTRNCSISYYLLVFGLASKKLVS